MKVKYFGKAITVKMTDGTQRVIPGVAEVSDGKGGDDWTTAMEQIHALVEDIQGANDRLQAQVDALSDEVQKLRKSRYTPL